jgi:hypothetical protein
VALAKKVGVLKIVWPKPRPGPRGTSAIELVLPKPIGVSKKSCFSDAPSSSLGQRNEGGSAMQMPGGMVTNAVGECATRVLKFASSSPPKKAAARDVPMRSVAAPG